MGANQSRPSDAAINEKLIERLQALHMKDERGTSEKDGFIVVDGEARRFLKHHTRRRVSNMSEAPRYTPITRHQQDVSATTVEQWEKELMDDPKVDYIRQSSSYES
jgi:bleomycin hydrolase